MTSLSNVSTLSRRTAARQKRKAIHCDFESDIGLPSLTSVDPINEDRPTCVPRRSLARHKKKRIMLDSLASVTGTGIESCAMNVVKDDVAVPKRSAARHKKRDIMADVLQIDSFQPKMLKEVSLDDNGENVPTPIDPTETSAVYDELPTQSFAHCSYDTTSNEEPPDLNDIVCDDVLDMDESSVEGIGDSSFDSDQVVSISDSDNTVNYDQHLNVPLGNVCNVAAQSLLSGTSFDDTKFDNDLLLLALKLRHKMTAEAIDDLTRLCNFFGNGQCVSKNKYFFDKQFEVATTGFDFYYMCEDCKIYVKGIQTPKLQCTNPACTNVDVIKKNRSTFFAYLSLEKQLRDLLENHNVEHLMNFTGNSQTKRNINNFEDIYDGALYKSSVFLGETNLSLSFNSDGVPVFKSSSCGIWPILCTVNELPPHVRKDHVLLAAIWFGASKPDMNVFFEPFVDELRKLNETGLMWTRADKSIGNAKVTALVGVCDSVARPALQSFSQFNGKYGCSFCYDSGVCVKQGKGHTRVYPFDSNSLLRTKESVVDLAEQATVTRHAVMGVKGPSIVQLIPSFDIIQGLVPDYMHSVLLGVVRQLGKLWFDSSNHEHKFYISCANQKLIDFTLTSIRPPCNISRLPRSISDRKFWKAHEWYAWLCYYCLPVLSSYLPPKFLSHMALLVDGITLLLSDSISVKELDHCDVVLKKFVLDFETLYGQNNVSFNVHLCLHLTSSVRAWGPLWTHSAFVYEAFNCNLLDMIKGTQAVPLQICKTYALLRSMPLFITKATRSDGCSSEYKAVLQSLMPRGLRLQNSETVGDVTFLGRSRLRHLNDSHLAAMCNVVAAHIPNEVVVQYYDRIIVRGEIVHSNYYCRSLKRNSNTVVLDDGSLFSIEHFINVCFGADQDHGAYALGYELIPLSTPIFRHPRVGLKLSHLRQVSPSIGQIMAVRAKRIVRKCIFIHIPHRNIDIVCQQLNMFEYCT